MHSFESVCFIQIVIVFLLYSYVNPSTGSHSTSSQDLQQEASVHLMQQLSSLEDPHNQVLLDKREASPHGFPTTYINSSSWSAANTPPSQSHLLTIEDDAMECIFVRSEDGVYRFWADNSLTHTLDEVCGLYMIARPDQLIQFDFQRLNVSCDGSNALSIVDGWELNGQLFPSSNDHQLERSLRFRPVCGNQVPFSLRTVRMSQNVALLQFRIQSPGEGFQVNVRFIPNPMRKFLLSI